MLWTFDKAIGEIYYVYNKFSQLKGAFKIVYSKIMSRASANYVSNLITDLSLEYTHFEDVELAMRKSYNSKTKLLNKVTTRDELKRLQNDGTNEVITVTNKLCKKINNDEG